MMFTWQLGSVLPIDGVKITKKHDFFRLVVFKEVKGKHLTKGQNETDQMY